MTSMAGTGEGGGGGKEIGNVTFVYRISSNYFMYLFSLPLVFQHLPQTKKRSHWDDLSNQGQVNRVVFWLFTQSCLSTSKRGRGLTCASRYISLLKAMIPLDIWKNVNMEKKTFIQIQSTECAVFCFHIMGTGIFSNLLWLEWGRRGTSSYANPNFELLVMIAFVISAWNPVFKPKNVWSNINFHQKHLLYLHFIVFPEPQNDFR